MTPEQAPAPQQEEFGTPVNRVPAEGSVDIPLTESSAYEVVSKPADLLAAEAHFTEPTPAVNETVVEDHNKSSKRGKIVAGVAAIAIGTGIMGLAGKSDYDSAVQDSKNTQNYIEQTK